MRLPDKVAIVTGGGTGIGAAVAETFAREGARVTVTGRRKEMLAEVVDRITAAGGHALAVPGGVTDEADVQRAVQSTLATFGRVDVLVTNAGSALHAGPLHETSDRAWNDIIDVFLTRVFRFSRAVIPQMQRQGGGAIVNVGSVLGLKDSAAFPVHPYAAAKAGVAMLTRTIAAHYAKDHIRCNCVAPAVTETPLTAPRLRDPATRRAVEGAQPVGVGTPEDVARAVLYLTSDEARWTTGSIVAVDGGVLA
jgi:NAD(P)-dependent dehydrogenase (short-subunit alcohol dehydrogenase family)